MGAFFNVRGIRMKPDHSIDRLVEIVAKLRAPDGCPWDREQTHESLKSGLIEETYEVIDAIEQGSASDLQEELGDLLLQVVFHSQLAKEEDLFSLAAVVDGVCDKLVRRHPHVFSDVNVSGTEEVLQNWDAIKKEEKKNADNRPVSILDGIPRHLPALQKAYQTQKRAARAGFDWDGIDDVFDKLHEEIDELKDAIKRQNEADIKEELGDLLFSAVNVSRYLKHNPEEILNQNIKKFTKRFQVVEREVMITGRPFSDFTLTELDAFWDQAKSEEK